MLPARPSRLVVAWFDWYCRAALRRQFRRLHLYGESPAALAGFDRSDPARPHLYLANYSSFWDGIVLNHLVRTHRRQPLYCMIDEREVRAHPFFRRVGGFSVDLDRPRHAARSLDYAAGLQRSDPPAALVLFAQGAALPNDLRPVAFKAGAARLIERVPGLRVVPVALRYEFGIQQKPEALVAWGEPRAFDPPPDRSARRRVADELAAAVTRLHDRLKEAGLSRRPGDRIVLRGRRALSDREII